MYARPASIADKNYALLTTLRQTAKKGGALPLRLYRPSVELGKQGMIDPHLEASTRKMLVTSSCDSIRRLTFPSGCSRPAWKMQEGMAAAKGNEEGEKDYHEDCCACGYSCDRAGARIPILACVCCNG